MAYKIKDLKSTDDLIEKLLVIENTCFDEHCRFDEESLEAMIEECPILLGMYLNNVLVGYSAASLEYGGYLYTNAIMPKHRGHNLGQRMVDERIRRLKAA